MNNFKEVLWGALSRPKIDIFFSHYNFLLSLIDEVDFIKDFIIDGNRQIKFQLIIVCLALPCAQNIYHATVKNSLIDISVGSKEIYKQ